MRWLNLSIVRFLLAAVPVVLWTLAVIAMHLPGPLAPVVAAFGTLVIYIVYVRRIERRPVHELGRPGAGRELGIGLLLGAALFTATLAIMYAAGFATLTWSGATSALLFGAASAAAAAVSEEILIRAILFRIVERGLGTWIALVVSSAVFGIGHIANPAATLTSTVAIALEAGLMLAAALMVTRRLWLPIGLHAAWNFTQGSIFGAAVSGFQHDGLFASRFDGPALLTGGEFGPEASVIALVLCLSLFAVFLTIARRRGHIVQPYWRRATAAPRLATAG